MTTHAVPLAVAIPLLTAALLAATTTYHPRRAAEAIGTAAAAAAAALTGFLVVATAGGTVVYWFGGWRPSNGIAFGVDFAVDPFGAGLAAFAAFLVTATFVYGLHYFDDLGQTLFHALMLVFLAALVGFALTGDLFNLFVFFELATVPAIVLTSYMNEEGAPLQGQVNFAVLNSLAGFVVLTGIALLYGRTGALNLAQIEEALSGRPADGLVVTAFVLLVTGFFVKAAVVPFHFWLADAYAVAPAPICVVFSGVMSELGLYAVARIYWTSFADVLAPHEDAVRTIFLAAGIATGLVGAVMALQQANMKRLLAFATIAHIGLFLMGIGLLSSDALGGVAVWLVADGLARGALFMVVGMLARRFGSVDDADLHGLGRRLPAAGALYAAGALALLTLPPFGTFLGKALVEDAATKEGHGWVPVVFLVVTGLAAASVLKAGAAVFLGWGAPQDEARGEDEPGGKSESEEEGGEPPGVTGTDLSFLHYLLPGILLAVSLALGLVPNIGGWAVHAAERFRNPAAYAAAVFARETPPAKRLEEVGAKWIDVAWSAGTIALALAAAALALSRPRVRGLVTGGRAVTRFAALHSGHVGDYVAWLTVGISAFGLAFALTLT